MRQFLFEKRNFHREHPVSLDATIRRTKVIFRSVLTFEASQLVRPTSHRHPQPDHSSRSRPGCLKAHPCVACVIRLKTSTGSTGRRPGIPVEADHGFRSKASTDFGEGDHPRGIIILLIPPTVLYGRRVKASIAWNSCELRPPVKPCGGADTVGIIGETAAAIGECLVEGIEILEVGVGDDLIGQRPEMLRRL